MSACLVFFTYMNYANKEKKVTTSSPVCENRYHILQDEDIQHKATIENKLVLEVEQNKPYYQKQQQNKRKMKINIKPIW